ncbi:unnamed protein product, partial [Iphiclides podalirius]
MAPCTAAAPSCVVPAAMMRCGGWGRGAGAGRDALNICLGIFIAAPRRVYHPAAIVAIDQAPPRPATD